MFFSLSALSMINEPLTWAGILGSHRHASQSVVQAQFIYDEIFVRPCYIRHGVRVRNGDTVIDAGANVGLFTLFLLRGGAIGCAPASC